VEREIGAGAMRLRAARIAVTTKGQGSRHGKEIIRNAVSNFLFGDFFKSEKVTRCRTESCIPRHRAAGDGIPALSFPAGRNPAPSVPRAGKRRASLCGEGFCRQKPSGGVQCQQFETFLSPSCKKMKKQLKKILCFQRIKL
jgi:hypothetical protein